MKQSGFTLIEMMVVVVIIALLSALLVPRIMGRPDEARLAKAKQDVIALETALDLYRLDNGFYPTTLQGLKALVQKPTQTPIPKNYKKGGYIKRLPNDPWGHPYQYRYPGQMLEVDVFSLGRDGKPGGEGLDADIGNWNIETIGVAK